MLRIQRAHDYKVVEAVRHELSRLPDQWLEDASFCKWIILPDDLLPSWTGIMKCVDVYSNDGRSYDTIGGWYAPEATRWGWNLTPHIYLNHSSVWAAVHELGHALEDAWNAPVKELFKPEKALYSYMASNPKEYFACAVDAFSRPKNQENWWNTEDLFRADPNIHLYLSTKLGLDKF